MRVESGEAGPALSGANGKRGSLAGLASLLRRICGMPDYQARVEHLRRLHPEKPVPSERQFYEEYLRTRYGDGPTRCC